MKLRFKTPRISFFLYVVGDPRAIFVQKNVVLGMRRSLCESVLPIRSNYRFRSFSCVL